MTVASKSIAISQLFAVSHNAGQKIDGIVALHDACNTDSERTALIMALAAELVTAQMRLALR